MGGYISPRGLAAPGLDLTTAQPAKHLSRRDERSSSRSVAESVQFASDLCWRVVERSGSASRVGDHRDLTLVGFELGRPAEATDLETDRRVSSGEATALSLRALAAADSFGDAVAFELGER